MKEHFSRTSKPGKDVFSPLEYVPEKALSSDSDILKKMFVANLGKEDYSWFAPLSFFLSSSGERTLTVHLPHELFFRWYTSVGRSLLEKSARELLGEQLLISYAWPGHESPREKQRIIPPAAAIKNPSLEDFIVGGKNREVLQLFRRFLSGSPGILLLHGPSGSGKSHLLLSAFSDLKERMKGSVVLFSGRELIALFQRSAELAHAALLSSSAVLVDDIQLLEKHPSLQKELASLLDGMKETFFLATYQTDGSDESGQKLLPLLYDRLCSSLSLGLAEPDLDVRLRFTQACMEKIDLPDHRKTALFLARHCLRLRHIRGVLEQVSLRYEQNAALPSESELSSLLGRAGAPQPVDTSSILAVVASRYGCTSQELCENTKENRLILPRQIAMYLCRTLLGESYPSLGTLFGGKDHSTVMYAVKKIEKLRVTNNDMNSQLTELTKQCRNGLQRRGN